MQITITSTEEHQAEFGPRVFAPGPKASGLLKRTGRSSWDMETLEPNPFNRDESTVKFKAKSEKVTLLVERIKSIGTISVLGTDTMLSIPQNAVEADIPDMVVETIPGKDYLVHFRKPERDLGMGAESIASITAILK
ncbi:hypothetical protein [Paraglaciecola chathamensis]|uniref:Uncharacterized protein n=1 Tax=Paraglaciecola agarilytica NO2 TaxID=1125747 RepID=A0ABQ0IC10_9ALTE|nr:hypothetical protein [Paraglaciecola agarilytica]GAC06946.1 hypothetical protein GAGA_4114 [Paraglaciecola agarilytica NO2]